jgi:hypothetical protein
VENGFNVKAPKVIRGGQIQDGDARRAAFREAVAQGAAQLDRGEGRELTPELLGEMTQRALDEMHSGKPITPEVLPESA